VEEVAAGAVVAEVVTADNLMLGVLPNEKEICLKQITWNFRITSTSTRQLVDGRMTG
jgi:hypothetical protein